MYGYAGCHLFHLVPNEGKEIFKHERAPWSRRSSGVEVSNAQWRHLAVLM